jgi:hypothetical protein
MEEIIGSEEAEVLVAKAVVIRKTIFDLQGKYETYLLMDKEFHELKAIKEEIKDHERKFNLFVDAAQRRLGKNIQ